MNEQSTLNVRGIDRQAKDRIMILAKARGLTVGAYLPKLVALHDIAREIADHPDDNPVRARLAAELTKLGLQSTGT